MSGHRVTFLLCDGATCGESWGLELDPGPLVKQRRAAQIDGWLVGQPGGKDYCSQECKDDPAVGGEGRSPRLTVPAELEGQLELVPV